VRNLIQLHIYYEPFIGLLVYYYKIWSASCIIPDLKVPEHLDLVIFCHWVYGSKCFLWCWSV